MKLSYLSKSRKFKPLKFTTLTVVSNIVHAMKILVISVLLQLHATLLFCHTQRIMSVSGSQQNIH